MGPAGPGGPSAAPGPLTPPPAVLKPVAASLAGVVRAPLAIIKNAGALIGNDGSTLIGNDGSTLIGNDGSTLIGNDGGTLIGNDGSTLIGNDGSTLIGNDGSTLIGNDGSTLIGNDGSTLIGNDGSTLVGRYGASLTGASAYRLQAVGGQAPVQGATVRLLTAAGQPVMAGGVAVSATTDAAGAYAFGEAQVPPGAVVVAELGAKKVTLRAIATLPVPAVGTPAAAAKRQVDVEIVSTLTAAYILETYVAAQADPNATLAKLTPEAEAATRAAAERLLKLGKVAIPADLAPAGMAASMGRLRKASQELNGKLEAVKALLIAAGLSDLGAGELATTVPLGRIEDLAPAPGGGAWFYTPGTGRIWWLRPDQRLETLVGAAGVEGVAGGAAQVDGRPGAQVALGSLSGGLAADAEGRLVYAEDAQVGTDVVRFVRVSAEAPHTLKVLATSGPVAGWAPGAGDEIWVARRVDGADGMPERTEIGTVGPGRPFTLVRALTEQDAKGLGRAYLSGRDAAGRLYFSVDTALWRVDPAAPGAAPVDLAPQGSVDHAYVVDPNHVDRAGNRVELVPSAAGQLALTRIAPDGTRQALTAFAEALLDPDPFMYRTFVVATDGTAIAGEGGVLWRYGPAGRVAIAGRQDDAPASRDRLPLEQPGGAAVGADGALLVADTGRHQVLRWLPGQAATIAAGLATATTDTRQKAVTRAPWGEDMATFADDGGAAAKAVFCRPTRVFREPAGTWLVVDDASLDRYWPFSTNNTFEHRLRRIQADGSIATLAVAPWGDPMQVALGPDGAVYVSFQDKVFRVGQEGPVATVGGDHVLTGLAVAKDGTFYALTAEAQLLRGRPGQAGDWEVLPVKLPALIDDEVLAERGGYLAIDAAGRLYAAGFVGHKVVQIDPQTRVVKAIAGPGSTHFAGSGIDDSLLDPSFPAMAPSGDLYLSDVGHRQIKRIPAAELD